MRASAGWYCRDVPAEFLDGWLEVTADIDLEGGGDAGFLESRDEDLAACADAWAAGPVPKGHLTASALIYSDRASCHDASNPDGREGFPAGAHSTTVDLGEGLSLELRTPVGCIGRAEASGGAAAPWEATLRNGGARAVAFELSSQLGFDVRAVTERERDCVDAGVPGLHRLLVPHSSVGDVRVVEAGGELVLHPAEFAGDWDVGSTLWGPHGCMRSGRAEIRVGLRRWCPRSLRVHVSEPEFRLLDALPGRQVVRDGAGKTIWVVVAAEAGVDALAPGAVMWGCGALEEAAPELLVSAPVELCVNSDGSSGRRER